MSTILEDNNVREKRRHICPKRGLWTILSVKKWTYFLGSDSVGVLSMLKKRINPSPSLSRNSLHNSRYHSNPL
jgi:hypothetical protein